MKLIKQNINEDKNPALIVSGYCCMCGKAIYGRFVFSFPISLPHEELCMCGQLKSKRFEDTIEYK